MNHKFELHFPKVLPLMTLFSKLKLRKVKQVLKFHVPNEELEQEKFAHHLLFPYYPFRFESELILNGSYINNFPFLVFQTLLHETAIFSNQMGMKYN